MADKKEKTAEEIRRDAITRTVRDSKKYAFAKAHWLPKIIDIYNAAHPGISYYEFKNTGLPWVTDALERILFGDHDEKQQDENIIFRHFAELLDPTIDRKAGKECKYLDWACRNWIKTPVMVEDMYKTRERLNYFEQSSSQLKKDGQPNQISKIDSFAHLEEIMRPYEVEKARKEAERAERRMSAEDKARLSKETTVFYQGPEGKIVMPHTKWACQYWGNQTEWCISAAKSENYFDGYDEHWPIIIYLPKVTEQDLKEFPKYSSFKSAAVRGEVYDECDETKAIMPECLRKLARAADGHSEYLNKFGSREFILQTKSALPSKESRHESPYYDFRREWLYTPDKPEIPKEYWQDKEFFKHFYDEEDARPHFPAEFYADCDLAMDILKDYLGWSLGAFDENVQKNKAANRLLISKSPESFDRLHPVIRKNEEMRLLCKEKLKEKAASRQYTTNPCDIPQAFQDDLAFAKEIIDISPFALNGFSEDIRRNIDVVLIARAITKGENRNVFDSLNIDALLEAQLSALKGSPDIFRAALKAAGGDDLSKLARKIIEGGHGLSDKLVPKELLDDIEGYVYPVIQIATEKDHQKYLVRHLRKVPALRGDAAAVTSAEGAIAKLEGMKRPPSVKLRRSYQI